MITRDGVAPRASIPPPERLVDLRGLVAAGPAASVDLWCEAAVGGVATLDDATFTAWHERERCWLVASETDPRQGPDVFVTSDARYFRVTRASDR